MRNLELEQPIAFFDLETTGINPAKDRIIEIAVIKINTDGTRDKFIKRINPQMPIPPESSAIHGIYDEDVKEAPIFNQIAHELKQFLNNCNLAGYNSNRFDVPVLAEEFLRANVFIDFKTRKFIDVQQIFFKMEERTLSAAYQFYCNKDLVNAHAAEADVTATIDILEAQLERYNNLKRNVDFLHQFTGSQEIVDFARRMIIKDGKIIFNFGKYKNQYVHDVLERDPSYYDWIMKSDFTLDTKQCISNIYNEMRLKNFKK